MSDNAMLDKIIKREKPTGPIVKYNTKFPWITDKDTINRINRTHNRRVRNKKELNKYIVQKNKDMISRYSMRVSSCDSDIELITRKEVPITTKTLTDIDTLAASFGLT
jgi:hypothetical protein